MHTANYTMDWKIAVDDIVNLFIGISVTCVVGFVLFTIGSIVLVGVLQELERSQV